MELIIENVRSFAGKHTIPIKPLTLLTGENSSGKSTLLAALSVVGESATSPLHPRFNESPYALGNYDSIATFDEANSTHAPSFSIGYRHIGAEVRERIASYTSNQGLVEASSIVAKKDKIEGELTFHASTTGVDVEIRITQEGRSIDPVIIPCDLSIVNDRAQALMVYLSLLLLESAITNLTEKTGRPGINFFGAFNTLFNEGIQQQVLSIAPIRTKPQRTYDEIIREFAPEGRHTPFTLSSLLHNPELRVIMERFGHESGLYTKLDVKKLGEQLSDPAQIMVMSSSKPINLANVGYGVSQVLPIVVESILSAPQTLLLIQQPEVHLHPRAQAALGSLFANLAVKGDKGFVIETHSDYVIDRVRMEVARGNISAKDVGILYLEKCDFQTRVHSLELSDTGDILNAPPSYRAFFLEEELNLFRRAGR